MFSVIKAEIKKNFKIGVIAVWLFGIFISYSAVYTLSVGEGYSDVFFKYFGMAPIMGLVMFMMFSGSFILEYNSNMDGLIKATKNGKKQLVVSKFIAAGLSASIVNLSMLYAMAFKVFFKFKFDDINMPIKNLWYFGKSGSDITVIQLLLIMSVTVILGSFMLAALGLFLSSISKNAIIPFLVGGAFMAIPYFMGMRRTVNSLIVIPIFGMYAVPIIRFALPSYSWIVFCIFSIVTIVLFYNLAKKKFLSER
ncbi:hypothetical protein [Clostridium sp. CCUG 7971]|uniref:hypothetical protein n=1 Tax=Clostridium sp. CCUG 7971 TaxID=2811414 RepID=UPI001ABB8A9E|nr:hypothetical protein [Clostridium sp. CCUG 7971]MBO3446343.1 hypothetical protein [Clostridium sp. CCUG 7971]